MRYSLIPDPSRPNLGFLKRDRGLVGLGQYDADMPADPGGGSGGSSGGSPSAVNTTTGGFWSGVGTEFLSLARQFAPGLVNWGITGNKPQTVVSPQGNVSIVPGGSVTTAKVTGGVPTWVWPAAIGAAVLLFVVAKKK